MGLELGLINALLMDLTYALTCCSPHQAKLSLSLNNESISSPDVGMIWVSEMMLALGTKSGSEIRLFTKQLSDARCAPCTIARAYVWVQLVLGMKVCSERTD
jgi:hypothetical protein